MGIVFMEKVKQQPLRNMRDNESIIKLIALPYPILFQFNPQLEVFLNHFEILNFITNFLNLNYFRRFFKIQSNHFKKMFEHSNV